MFSQRQGGIGAAPQHEIQSGKLKMRSIILRGLCLGLFAALFSVLTGCASVIHGSEQTVKIETLSKEGKAIDGADCKVSNDKASASVDSGKSVKVRRSGGNLAVQCSVVGQPPASGQAISRANGALAGNILIGGVIGIAIDVATGSAFSYPAWLQLVFGEDRSYDRTGNHDDEKPVVGTVVEKPSVAQATGAASQDAQTVE